MSGILGIWNLDGKPLEVDLLKHLSATLAHRGADGEGLWIDGPVGLACQLFRVTPESLSETQPCVDTSGVAVVFDGRLDNREELLAILKSTSDLSAKSPDPDFVLAAYRLFGDRFPERLIGDFALGLFDSKRQQLLLARDAVGARPLYYCRTGETFVFASEIKALLAHPQVAGQPNDELLAKCALGQLTEDDQWFTCFAGVSSLPPSHSVVVTREKFATRRYWDFDCSRKIRLGSLTDYAQAFRHYFEQAVRRRYRSAYPVAVALSGGLDSSSVFCMAQAIRKQELGHHPSVLGISNTYMEDSPSDEKIFLLDIERKYGVKVERVPMQPIGLVNDSREQLRQGEVPFLSLQWNSYQVMLRASRQLGARVLMTGQSGDQMLFDEAYLIDLFRSFSWIKIWTHLNEFPRWLTDAEPGVFRRDFFHNLLSYHIPDSFRLALRRIRTQWSPAPVDRALYTSAFRQWAESKDHVQLPSRRFATAYTRSMYKGVRSTFHLLGTEWYFKTAAFEGMEVSTSFLDRDLISFLIAIPGEVQCLNGVPKGLLREAMQGVLPEPIRRRRWKADLTDAANDAVTRDFSQILQHLESNAMAMKFGYVSQEKIKEELSRWRDKIRGPTFEVGARVLRFMGLELWLQTSLWRTVRVGAG